MTDMVDVGTMRERLNVLELVYDKDADAYRWREKRRVWAGVEQDDRNNLFSSVGIGVRGVTFTIRCDPALDLHNAYSWNGRHCFLTRIRPDTPTRGFWMVSAAPVTVRSCRKDADRTPAGSTFPAVLTEKYVGHEQPDLHAETVTDYVLVTPKEIELAPGSWVAVDGAYYRVLVPHVLDEFKNEFEIRRKEDC